MERAEKSDGKNVRIYEKEKEWFWHKRYDTAIYGPYKSYANAVFGAMYGTAPSGRGYIPGVSA
jgi:hypothetical protein